jgi:sterol desaturase/sphingolipid hydroxylase (fatty acid hydroxylase superfamily)
MLKLNNTMFNYLYPIYFPFIYSTASYIDYFLNKPDYHNYKDLFKKLDILFLNIYILIPITFISLFYFQPIINIYDNFYREIYLLLINIIFGDIWFYSLHRLFHNKILYKYIHKLHHSDKNPIGILSFHSHPIECIVVNMGSIYIIHYVFVCSTIQYFIVWTTIVFNSILSSHSRSYKNKKHHIHHKLLNYNFGVDIFMDRLFKTDRSTI